MPTHQRYTNEPKRIVYLWGAGATQAEISYHGAKQINLLMRNSNDLGEGVASRILKRLPAKFRAAFRAEGGTDIEKLVSLLAASSVDDYLVLAERIRRFYFEDIRDRLAEAKVLHDPRLAIGLLTLHRDIRFKQQEILSGIITTNHDGLLQLAAQRVHEEVNIGVPFQSNRLKQSETQATPLLHLHGSFTWTFGLPIEVSLLRRTSKYSPATVWIPPTILKEAKDYPFNKLAGAAYELLSRHCDVLRVIGSALTQNDWNILSLIFNAQRHSELTRGVSFRIELIMPPKDGSRINDDCSYLKNLTPIGFLTEGDFTPYQEEPPGPETKNPLAYWMKQKILFHRNRGDLVHPLAPAIAPIAGNPGGVP